MSPLNLTGRGWQVLVIGALVYLLARLFGTTQLYQLAFAMLALPAVGLGLAFWSGRGIKVHHRVPAGSRLMAGQQAAIEVVTKNEGWSPSPRLEVVSEVPESTRFQVPGIPGGGEHVDIIPVSLAFRGVYELGPAEIRFADPFGVLQVNRRFTGRTRVVVYPAVSELKDLPHRRGSAGSGGASGRPLRREHEFSGLREYRRGDDRRHIHWKSMARTGELIVKEFAASSPHSYTVALDLSRPAPGSSDKEVEDAVSAAASLYRYLTIHERQQVRLIASDRAGSATGFGVGAAAYWEAMETLAAVRADGKEGLEGVLNVGRGELGDGVFLITRGLNDALISRIQRLRTAGSAVVVVAVAAHTYRPMRGYNEQVRETEFIAAVGRLVQMGAVVRIVRYSSGLEAGLKGELAQGAG